jgi:hypothetical protein
MAGVAGGRALGIDIAAAHFDAAATAAVRIGCTATAVAAVVGAVSSRVAEPVLAGDLRASDVADVAAFRVAALLGAAEAVAAIWILDAATAVAQAIAAEVEVTACGAFAAVVLDLFPLPAALGAVAA